MWMYDKWVFNLFMSVVHFYEFSRKYNEFKLPEKLKFKGEKGTNSFPCSKVNSVYRKKFWGKTKHPTQKTVYTYSTLITIITNIIMIEEVAVVVVVLGISVSSLQPLSLWSCIIVAVVSSIIPQKSFPTIAKNSYQNILKPAIRRGRMAVELFRKYLLDAFPLTWMEFSVTNSITMP